MTTVPEIQEAVKKLTSAELRELLEWMNTWAGKHMEIHPEGTDPAKQGLADLREDRVKIWHPAD